MTAKTVPLGQEALEEIAARYATPFHLYDERGIRSVARRFNQAFAWAPGYRNYFAVKACPNPAILAILKEEGQGVDCSSLPELLLAERAGFFGEEIILSSNDTPVEEFYEASRLDALINLDDITHLETLAGGPGVPNLISYRYNPGDTRSGNSIIGLPREAKYGVTDEQIGPAFDAARRRGARRFALHTMVASNELVDEYFVDTARMLFQLAVRLRKDWNIRVEMVNLGGGMGIPYHPADRPLDIEAVAGAIENLYTEIIVPAGLAPLRVATEYGRVITGPHGYLVSRVRHVAEKYKVFVGLDACMADLMRPAIYGAYHHISVPGKDDLPADRLYDVTGSLCENNDKFAIDRYLPQLKPGDLVVIHDTGAHGYAMGFNYNGKLRSGELLLRENGTIALIRRPETVEDYFATLDF